MVSLVGHNVLSDFAALLDQPIKLLLVTHVLVKTLLLHPLLLDLVQFHVFDHRRSNLRILNLFNRLFVFTAFDLHVEHSCNLEFLLLAALQPRELKCCLSFIALRLVVLAWLLDGLCLWGG